MRLPDLQRIREEHDAGPKILRWCSPLHPDPRLWKHDWWLFTRHAALDGQAFLGSLRERMCTAEAMAWLEIYRQRGETVWIYGGKHPRRDPVVSPFDPDHPKWRNALWAPAYDEDNDPVWLSPDGVAYK